MAVSPRYRVHWEIDLEKGRHGRPHEKRWRRERRGAMWSSSISTHLLITRFVELMLESGLGREQVEALLIANPRPMITGEV